MTEPLDASLAEVEKNWNEFGRRDPLWAILTDDSKRNGKWDPAEFFARGEREIDGVLKYAEGLKHRFPRGKALDFGCGVGRLTQALCRHFEECHGVDIAESMVAQARQYNRHGDRCHYHVNKKPDLAIFGDDTFDFIYTNIVLQHNPPDVSRRFIEEFLRILKPGGQLVFQLPSEPIGQLGPQSDPMNDQAFKAGISLAGSVPQMTAGTSLQIPATVKNLSAHIWPGKAVSGKLAVRLGNHWRDTNNRMVIQDDARADLPHDLKPDGEVALQLTITVPGTPGRFRLELDMVQEQVAWFANKGSQPLFVDVDVVPRAATPGASSAGAPEAPKTTVVAPRMDMNGIPKAEVVAFLSKLGGKLLDVIDDGAATGWVSYRYHVVKERVSIPKTNGSPRRRPADAKYTEDILAALKGRTAIVGNATPTHSFGEIIDQYDNVIRLNNFRVAGFEKLVGSKTDFRCTSAWHDIEHRDGLIEFSPFTAAATESGNLETFNRANAHPVLHACMDIHPLVPETPKPSTGFSLIQLCSYMGVPVDLFAFDGFKTAHYWDKNEGNYTTHSRGEVDFILKRPGVLLYGETYPYQALYDFCHKNHHDYDVNVGLELVRQLKKEFHGLKMIEFGAGNGHLSRHLEQQGNRVTAVEASRHAFERIPCSSKIHGTALNLPFIRETFDLFVSVDVLEHLTENDCKLVIREAARLCKGLFVSVCTRPSGLLGPNGENLHLTVRPPSWWAKQFGEFFDVRTYPGYGNGQLVIEGERKAAAAPVEISGGDSDEFYVNLFIKNPVWSTPHPNEDEAARWEKISGFVKNVAAGKPEGERLRILDVGCGRGWLTNLASSFGECEGVEPVAAVVEQARKLFPQRRFTAGTGDTILNSADFKPYDLVLTSEVIEHVPRNGQPDFANKLFRLLKPGGHVILTTPRGEALQEWTRLAGDPSQPVEDWICEPELRELFVNQKFGVAGHERVLFDTTVRRYITGGARVEGPNLLPIYQVWDFQKPAAQPCPAPRSANRPPGYSFCIITNGKRPQKLAEEIAGIRALGIPEYEILVGGDVPAGLEGVKAIAMPDAARGGRLGEMRNRLVEDARYDHVVVADDDLLFQPDFYKGLQQFGDDYEVLCVRFLNVDGTRYWDWATGGGPRGHRLLDYDETDPHVYVTGGLCVMKTAVADLVKWDDNRGFYQGEDLDFSSRLHQAGISIRFNRHSSVVHSDPRYTEFGGVIMTPETLRQSAIDKFEEQKWDEAQELARRLRTMDPASADALEKEMPAIVKPRLGLPVRWRGPIFNPSGYASEAISYILPLSRRVRMGIFHQNNLYSDKFVAGLKTDERNRLFVLRDKYPEISGGIVIEHNPANGFTCVPDAAYRIGRTMFETDRISPDWVTACNQLDEIWVPSKFNVETFAASGVERDKLHVMPESVDEMEFDPAKHEALPLPNRAAFNFLSIFEWSRRKGWDVLLAAYLREFSAADDVCLYLRTYLFSKPNGDPREAIEQLIRDHVATLKLGDKPLPRIEILADQVAQADLPRLYKAADCLVAPSRGEGWGRPHHEAMLMGLPVIATNWSGNTEFMNADNSFLIDYEMGDTAPLEAELRHYRNHRWANPSEQSLRQAMRLVQQNPERARATGLRARNDMLRQFSRAAVADLVVDRLQEIERKLVTPACPAIAARPHEIPAQPAGQKTERVHVTWQGTFLDFGSLSHVNRELTGALASDKSVQLTRVGPTDAVTDAELKNLARFIHPEPPRQADVTVRHAWPPDWKPPSAGAWVLIQPWEFGVLPADWVKKIANVDEVWAPSEFVRRVYVESGVHPSKVKIVPNGIDPEKFRPGVEALPLATKKKFKFLFVGGTIHRKGPDVLLKAYLETFTAADDVCLIIKDFGGQSIYKGQTFESEIAAARRNPDAPEILYLTEEMPQESMPRLYAACQCLVHPYRGEGFGLPVLEAMACGLPVVVTGGGSTDDFATDEFAYRLPALRAQIGDSVGGLKLQRAGWWLEPVRSALAERLRWIAAHPDDARARGLAASEHVRRDWTWKRAGQIASRHLQNLVARKKAEAAAKIARNARKAAPIVLPAVAKIGALATARELFAKKDLAAAWKVATDAIESRPFHPEAYLLLAEIALAAGDADSATRCAKHARAMAPEWKPAKKFLNGGLRGSAKPAWLAMPAALVEGHPAPAPRLSVCLIAKNEEKFLSQCLASVRGLAGEIILVDTGSRDRTIEIAREHGAQVHHFPWCDDFAAARNAALEHATGDWVLVLDADEEVMPGQAEILAKEMASAGTMAYRIPIIDKGREQDGCSYVPRLFRNAPGLFFLGRIHEQAFSSIEVRCKEWSLRHDLGKTTLLHHGYVKDIVVGRNKIERNLKLLELAIEELPNEPNLLMNYGLELIRSGHFQSGVDQYIEALRCLKEMPASQVVPELRETLLTQLTAHLMTGKCFEEIVRVWELPIAKSGMTASNHFSLGLAHMELKQPALAADQMRLCLQKRRASALSPINREILKAGPSHCLALCLSALKQTDAARDAFTVAMADDPESRRVIFDYARFQSENGQPLDALRLLNGLVAENPEEPHVWLLGGMIALSRPDFAEFARDWTGEAMKHFPDLPAVMLQRAEALLLTQDAEAALPLWVKAHSPKSPRHLAAIVLCEILSGGCNRTFPPADEALVSQEFAKWYRLLIAVNAHSTISQLNERIGQLRAVLPGFVRVWESAIKKARETAPA